MEEFSLLVISTDHVIICARAVSVASAFSPGF